MRAFRLLWACERGAEWAPLPPNTCMTAQPLASGIRWVAEKLVDRDKLTHPHSPGLMSTAKMREAPARLAASMTWRGQDANSNSP